MDETQQWRELLGNILHNQEEKQRVAHELKLTPITLTRWIEGDAAPRPQNLQLLLKVLPRHSAALLEVMPEAWKISLGSVLPADESLEEIPPSFFVRVLEAHATLPGNVLVHSLADMVMEQMLKHLDPRRLGMEITLALCSRPSNGGRVRSLRETVGRGTPPWSDSTRQRALLLGSESLAGYVVRSGRVTVIQSREEKQYLFPVHWTPWEESAMACPLLRAGRVAGCLLVSSTQPDYFAPARQTVIEHYALLTGLALESNLFYSFEMIDLLLMPPSDAQKAALLTFRQDVNDLLREAGKSGELLSLEQAEEEVWRQVETKLAEAVHHQPQ
jgi:GAF domain